MPGAHRSAGVSRILAVAGAIAIAVGAAAWLRASKGSAATSAAPAASADGDEAALHADPGRFQARILEVLRKEKDPLARRKVVAGLALLPEAVPILRAIYDENPGDPGVREEALMTSAKIAGPDATKWLAEIAGSSDAYAARAGAALGTVSNGKSAADLARLATGDAPVLVRANAARALAASGGPDQARVLTKLASDASQPLRVRQESALALVKLRDPQSVPSLIHALDAAADDHSGEGEQLRIALIQALGAIGGADAREALGRHVKRKLSDVEHAYTERALHSAG